MNLRTGHGDDISQPDAKTIQRVLLQTFEKPEQNFGILEDGVDSGNYIQAMPMKQPAQEHGCRVEYRDSQIGKHFAANSVPLETTITLFQQFNRGDQDFRKAIRWRNISRKFEWDNAGKDEGKSANEAGTPKTATPDNRSSAENTAPFSRELRDWAAFALETASEFFGSGVTAPFLLVLDENGQKKFSEIQSPSGGVSDELINAARDLLPGMFPSAPLYALVWDALLNVEGAAHDAIIIECGERDMPNAWLFAQRYRIDEDAQLLERLGEPMIVDIVPSGFAEEI